MHQCTSASRRGCFLRGSRTDDWLRFSHRTPPRWGDDVVQSDHASQHADGAVHEGHGDTICPPRSQRHHPQDHGGQTVLRGKGRVEDGGFTVLGLPVVRCSVSSINPFCISWRPHTSVWKVFFCFPSSWTLLNWRRMRMWTWTCLISSTSCLNWWRRSSWLQRFFHRKNTHAHLVPLLCRSDS